MATKVKRRVVPTGDDEDLDRYLKSDLFDVVVRYGDWDLLASYITDGGIITPPIRGYLADILRGKIKRPKNRPKKAWTSVWHRLIAEFVLSRRPVVCPRKPRLLKPAPFWRSIERRGIGSAHSAARCEGVAAPTRRGGLADIY
jgi:hypothetical protein